MASSALKQWREAMGYSQAQAGEAVGVVERTWKYWESGEREPPLSVLISTQTLRFLRRVDTIRLSESRRAAMPQVDELVRQLALDVRAIAAEAREGERV